MGVYYSIIDSCYKILGIASFFGKLLLAAGLSLQSPDETIFSIAMSP